VPIDVRRRLSARIAETRKSRPAVADRLNFGARERFAKSNPALSNIISFVAGLVVSAGTTGIALLTRR
jgi:hypothetical protein